MKNTKKLLLTLTGLCLLCTGFTGCGKEKEDLSDSQQEQTETTTEAAKETTAETEAVTTKETKATTTTKAEETTAESTSETAETETTASETTETTATTEAATEAPTQTEAPAPTEAPTEPIDQATQPPATEPPTEAPTEPPAAFSAEDLKFTYNGASLTVGEDASAFVSAVAPDSSESAPSCYGNGEDVNYYYPNFTLYIWDNDGVKLTYGIDIKSAGLATSKGISVGSSVNDLVAAYGSNYSVEGMDYVYAEGNSNLRFSIANDTVVYISYNYNL